MPSTNPFEVLNDTEDSGTACPIRQARKKLKAIEKLKNKMNKNPEEYAKIREESILRAIVEPVLTCASETPEDIEQRRTKQREKTQIKELKRKLNAQKDKHKQELLSMQRNMRLLEEEIQRLNFENQRLNEENQQLKKEKYYYKSDPVSIEKKIIKEFHDLYLINGCYIKTYKELIFKYHPDKYKSDDAHTISAILNNLRERYVG